MYGIVNDIVRVVNTLLRQRYFVPCALGLGFLIRCIWIVWTNTQVVSDGGWYFSQGLNIASGAGYVYPDANFPLWNEGSLPNAGESSPTAFWPIGYPAFLGLLFFVFGQVGEPIWIAKFAETVLFIGTALLALECSRRIFQSEMAARITVLILTVYPNLIAYTAVISVELFYMFLMMLSIWLLINAYETGGWYWVAASGLVFGAGTLTKPQTVLLPLVLLICIYGFQRKQLLRGLVILYFPLVLVLTPWLVRNYVEFDHFVFVSNNGGVNLWIGNNPAASGGYTYGKDVFESLALIPGEYQRDQAARAMAVDFILHNPLAVLRLLPHKLMKLYLFDVDGIGWVQLASERWRDSQFWLALKVVAQACYTAVVAMFVGSLVRRIQSKRDLFLLGPALIMYFTLIYLPFFGGPRFHLPFIPWYAIYAGAFLASTVFDDREASHGKELLIRQKPISLNSAGSASDL